jgi:hypothetical protein
VKSLFTLGGLLAVAGIGYFVYANSLTPAASQTPPQQQIDVVDIRANLMTIGQAERIYVTAHGTYATMEQLQQQAPPQIPAENRGYVFAIAVNGAQSFTATATPVDPDKAGWPTLEIDETMSIRER